jgi:homogentisate 1,2-dioxygenase
MPALARNSDGDELLFLHAGNAHGCFATTAGSSSSKGDYLLLPRGTMWRLEVDAPIVALLIEATNDSYRLPDKGLLGPHAIFDEAMLDTPKIDERFSPSRTSASGAWR